MYIITKRNYYLKKISSPTGYTEKTSLWEQFLCKKNTMEYQLLCKTTALQRSSFLKVCTDFEFEISPGLII